MCQLAHRWGQVPLNSYYKSVAVYRGCSRLSNIGAYTNVAGAAADHACICQATWQARGWPADVASSSVDARRVARATCRTRRGPDTRDRHARLKNYRTRSTGSRRVTDTIP